MASSPWRTVLVIIALLLVGVVADGPSPNATTVTPVPAPTTTVPPPTPSPTQSPTPAPPSPTPTPKPAPTTTAPPATTLPPATTTAPVLPTPSVTPAPTQTNSTLSTTTALPTPEQSLGSPEPLVSACVSCTSPPSADVPLAPAKNQPTNKVSTGDSKGESSSSSMIIILAASAGVGCSLIVALLVVRSRQNRDDRESDEHKVRAGSSFAVLQSSRDSTIPVLYSTKRLYEPSGYPVAYPPPRPAPRPAPVPFDGRGVNQMPSASPFDPSEYKFSDVSEFSADSSIRDTEDSRGLNAVSESYYGSQDSVITIEEEDPDDYSFDDDRPPRRTSSIQENIVWNDSMDREESMDSIVRESTMLRDSSILRGSSMVVGSDNPEWMNTERLMASDVHDF
ncbi:hypothetical protein ACHHYP_13595 [Achlya hypogyna]|uniref:Secreted protein n=1 Tax=Achlya hypogyna TaxID=1202772 RepID=A0A1V9ZFM2_ACHHY|nr:hypothetical protein ACHHYP_13595 [Achlya hypogyna]